MSIFPTTVTHFGNKSEAAKHPPTWQSLASKSIAQLTSTPLKIKLTNKIHTARKATVKSSWSVYLLGPSGNS